MKKNEIIDLIRNCEEELTSVYKNIDEGCFFYSEKVLDAMQEYHLSEACFSETTGYGYNDFGKLAFLLARFHRLSRSSIR